MGAMTFNEVLANTLKGDGGPKAQFDAKVAEIAKRDGRGRSDAMRSARIENPGLFEPMRAAPAIARHVEKAAPVDSAQSEARTRFVAKAREIAARDRIGQAAAMRKVRVEHPDLMAEAHD